MSVVCHPKALKLRFYSALDTGIRCKDFSSLEQGEVWGEAIVVS